MGNKSFIKVSMWIILVLAVLAFSFWFYYRMNKLGAVFNQNDMKTNTTVPLPNNATSLPGQSKTTEILSVPLPSAGISKTAGERLFKATTVPLPLSK